jgi:hypothetical protein
MGQSLQFNSAILSDCLRNGAPTLAAPETGRGADHPPVTRKVTGVSRRC